jgi:hypothetical protein
LALMGSDKEVGMVWVIRGSRRASSPATRGGGKGCSVRGIM